jgi:hypothetical protein
MAKQGALKTFYAGVSHQQSVAQFDLLDFPSFAISATVSLL